MKNKRIIRETYLGLWREGEGFLEVRRRDGDGTVAGLTMLVAARSRY